MTNSATCYFLSPATLLVVLVALVVSVTGLEAQSAHASVKKRADVEHKVRDDSYVIINQHTLPRSTGKPKPKKNVQQSLSGNRATGANGASPNRAWGAQTDNSVQPSATRERIRVWNALCDVFSNSVDMFENNGLAVPNSFRRNASACATPNRSPAQSAGGTGLTNPAPPPPPVITLTDLQELVVEPAQIIADKDGFGLKNGNTNFYSSTYKTQTSTQNMLGYQVDMEAEPVEWEWNYGDGTTLTTDQPGYPQKQFNEETPTSHVYTDTGEDTVTMTTHYTGRYRINDGEWITIPGRLSLTAEPMTADIWRAKTRNVYENCNQNPNGWGCNQNR